MLLTLTGFSFQYEWLRSGNVRALLLGSAALGLNLLTRVTTGLDLMAAGFFLLALLWFEHAHGRTLWERAVTYCKISVPIYAFFAIIERLYSFYRFGSLTQTYIPIFARESRLQDPTLPANFPWSTPFHEGVLGALFKPEKSIFLFDPMLVVALVCWFFCGRDSMPKCAPTQWRRSSFLEGIFAFTRATRTGPETSPGETAMSPPQSKWWHSLRCPCWYVSARR